MQLRASLALGLAATAAASAVLPRQDANPTLQISFCTSDTDCHNVNIPGDALGAGFNVDVKQFEDQLGGRPTSATLLSDGFECGISDGISSKLTGSVIDPNTVAVQICSGNKLLLEPNL